MASDEMIQVLRNHGVFTYGQESDIESIADDWETWDFTPAQADEWLSAGCFRASDAYRMTCVGITPEMASRDYDHDRAPGISIGYALANSDISLSEAKKIIEEMARMCLCTICKFMQAEISSDLSCQAMACCKLHPEYGRFVLFGNGCEEGEEVM